MLTCICEQGLLTSMPQMLMEGLFVLSVWGARPNPVQKFLLLIYPSQKDMPKPHF